MDRSNIRESVSFEENEENLRTMKTIHSLDEIYKTYVPQTEAKNTTTTLPTSILKSQNLENRKDQNCVKPQSRSTYPFQNFEFYGNRVKFSYISDNGYNELLNHPEYSSLRIASGQMNRKNGHCSSFDSSGGSQSCGLKANSVTFNLPERISGSSNSQNGCYYESGYATYPSYYDNAGFPDQYQQQFFSDPGMNYCCSQQASTGPSSGLVDGCSYTVSQPRSTCTAASSDNDNRCESSSQDEVKSIGSHKSLCCNEENKCSNTQVRPAISSDESAPAVSTGFKLSSFCPFSGFLGDTRPTPFTAISHHMEVRPCSQSHTSLNRRCRKVRIASDGCSKNSSRVSLRSNCSKNSGFCDMENTCSDRGFIMPEPECSKGCTEPAIDCHNSCDDCYRPDLIYAPMIGGWGCCNTNQCNNQYSGCMNNQYSGCMNNQYSGCNTSHYSGCNANQYNGCNGSHYSGCNTNQCNRYNTNQCNALTRCGQTECCTNKCCIDDALQDCTVYRREYKPIMSVCNHLYQHYGGCCWQDLPLGGGYGPCGGCASCGGYGPLSNLPTCNNLPACCTYIVDGNRYVPPTATLDTCSRPFCDRYSERSSCDSGGSSSSPCAGNSVMSGCCSVTPACCYTNECNPTCSV